MLSSFFFFTVFMAQSKAAVWGQRKGKNVSIGDAPPPPISSESAASNVEGRGLKDNDKYPLWKYVMRGWAKHQGKGTRQCAMEMQLL